MSEREYDEEPTEAEVSWLFGGSQNGSHEEEPPWAPVDLGAIPDSPPLPPELGGLGLAYRGKRHVFSGPQESAKTLCAYILGLEVLRHEGVFCLLDFEMGRWDARNRLRELGATDEELTAILYFEPEGKMPDRVPALVIERVQGRDALVVIDAAAGAFAFEELDDNKRMDVERFGVRYVEPFRKAGIATLVLDHVVKSSEARGNYAIGSERKVGATDVHLGFTVMRPISRGDHGRYKVTTHKDRGGHFKRGHLCDLVLTSDTETHVISWEFVKAQPVDATHPFRPTGLMEKVSRYLELQHSSVPMSQIEKEVVGKGEFIRKAVDVLVSEGFLEELEGPRKARLMLSCQAYRESTDDLVPTSSHLVPESAFPTSSLVPTPFRGDEDDGRRPETRPTSSQGSFGEDDIPW